MRMPIAFAYKSDIGQVHNHNEDFIWVDSETGLFIVADGMGGHEAGEVASQLSATAVAKALQGDIGSADDQVSSQQISALMIKAFETANESVLAMANQSEQSRRMGSTIVTAVLKLPSVYICHLGDARAYLSRNNVLTQITQDDSVVAELLAAGLISEEEAKTHIYRSVVTKAMGQDPPVEPTFTELTVMANDWLLICSDGLTSMISDEAIKAELNNAKGNPDYLVEALVKAANDAGGKDNISVIAIQVLSDEL